MSEKSFENLRTIRFEGELLPKWAHLLDLAAMLWEVPEPTRQWFSRFTNASGVDNAKTIFGHCAVLRGFMQDHREMIAIELKRRRDDIQPGQILAAWIYSLETMMLCAHTKSNCSWVLEGGDPSDDDGSDGGDIGLRRV